MFLNSEEHERSQVELVSIAESVLNGDLGVILGSRRLRALERRVTDEFDPDFFIFIHVDSETDHLPVDEERGNWSKEALERKDIEIAEAEALFKEPVVEGCRRIIDRFQVSKTAT
jgi:hypothetical protein